jgi:hypothetical protein
MYRLQRKMSGRLLNVLMLRMKTLLLWFRRTLLAVLVLLGAAWLWAQGAQWLLRLRAEKLLTDIRSLKVNRSSSADAQKLMSKWGEYRGACTAQGCKYGIHFEHGLPRFLIGYPDKGVRNWLPRLATRLGLRGWANVGAGFTVQNGLVTETDFYEDVMLPVQTWYSPPFESNLYVTSREENKSPSYGLEYFPVHSNRTARMNKFGLIVDFFPEENPSEKELLMNFRFNCITQLNPCLREDEILPEGWQLLQEEQAIPFSKRRRR